MRNWLVLTNEMRKLTGSKLKGMLDSLRVRKGSLLPPEVECHSISGSKLPFPTLRLRNLKLIW